MKSWIIGVLGLTLLSGARAWGEEPVLKGGKDRINYSVGYQIGGDFKRQGVELDPEILVQGIRDALGGTQPLMPAEEMHTTLMDLKRKIVTGEKERRRAREEKLLKEGREFLAENAKKEGIVTMASGLQYQVLQEGSGRKPALQDNVTVNYRGTKIDGTEFDSSSKEGKPATFPLRKVIPGWQEALPMMKEGARWKLFLPPGLAFGDKGPLEAQTVVYEIELMAVQPEKSTQGQAPAPPPQS